MGAIAWGRRLFGRVDRVSGRYHVATLCYHFCYLPLVPLGTYLILSQSMRGMTTEFRGIRLPFSLKSWLVAWSRTLLWFPFIMACVMCTMIVFPPKDDRPVPPAGKGAIAGITAALAGLLFGPYFIPGIGRATRNRASQLEAVAAGRGPAAVG